LIYPFLRYERNNQRKSDQKEFHDSSG
jgi:hypothetical protein